MSGDEMLFDEIKPIQRDTFVKFGDGERLKVEGSGQVTTPLGTLTALFVPHMSANLLSVSQLNQAGASVCFLPEKSEIRYQGRRFGVSLVSNIFQVDELCCLHSTTSDSGELLLWHQKLGHLNLPAVTSYLKRFGIVVPKGSGNFFCRVCAQAKLAERHFKTRTQRATSVLGRVHSDIGGPLELSSDGFRYWITFLDETSRFAVVEYLRHKSDAVTKCMEVLKRFTSFKSYGVAIFRSDGGGEYQSVALQDFFKQNGIQHEVTPPYTPQMNGMAERLNRTLVETVRCLIVSSGLNNSFWKFAMDYAVYIYNRTPHSGIGFKTPSEIFSGIDMVKLPTFHVFGSICYYHVAKELRTKLDMTGHQGLFLGFSNTSSLVLSVPDLVVKEVRTIRVDQGNFLSSNELKRLGIGAGTHPADIAVPTSISEPNILIPDITNHEDIDMSGDAEMDLQDDLEPLLPSAEIEGDDDHEDIKSDLSQGTSMDSEGGDSEQRTRSRREISYVEDDVEWHPRFGKRKIADEDDESWDEESSDSSYVAELVDKFLSAHVASQEDVLDGAKEASNIASLLSQVTDKIKKRRYNVQCTLRGSATSGSDPTDVSEPTSFNQAHQDPAWVKSMQDEFDSLIDNGTWELVELPAGRKVVKNKWVYKVKSDGRLKSRLVAKGFTQVAGVDFDETWSPVGRKASLKMLINLVLRKRWSWKQMDVDTAFLNSVLDEEIYMSQPQGFEDGTDRVCRLRKSIYGLKQASRAWYNTLREFLESQGLKRSRVDPCIYLADGIIVFVYVDDIIIAGDNEARVEELSNCFKKRFKMKDLGQPRRILGLDLIESMDGIMLSGESIITSLLKRYKMHGSRHVSTPLDPNQAMLPNSDSQADEESQSTFASVMGTLLYVANTFRPDISYAVSVLSQFTSNPSEDHWRHLKRVLRYLNGTLNYGLFFPRRDVLLPVLRGFTDADYGSCFTRKSRTGYAFFVGSSLISWSSRKQSVIALSTCEAEYYALTEGGKEAMHLKKLFWELENQCPFPDDATPDPVTIYCDNQSTIFVSKNPAEHKMMKHVDLRYKWIQEKVEQGEFQVEYVSTKDQVADIFTKALMSESFARLRRLCGVKAGESVPLAREC